MMSAVALVPACKRDAPPAPAAQSMPSQSAPAAPASAAAVAGHHASPPWFDGSVDQAFARARTDGSLVFLYWGAAWCPPCNELKAQVFNKPIFAEMVRGFVPVYLDGDTVDAQRLAETFAISAYPTIVILDPDKQELLRLGGSLDAGEVERALGSVRSKGQSFRAAMGRLESKTPTADDCNVLAHTAWELFPEDQWPLSKVMTSLRSAVDACPAKLMRERALLASTLVGLASIHRNDANVSVIVKQVAANVQTRLDLILASEETAWAARAFVNNRASDVAEWIEGKNPSSSTAGWKARWLEAAAWIRARKEASVDNRLSTFLPMLDFELQANPDKPISEATRTTIVAAVERADAEAKTQAERHAVVSTAAYMLRRVGHADRAKTMLLAEAERSNTPFYYYSSLAAQEQALGHMDEARTWTRKARESATGRATRLQWITHDVQLNAKPNNPEERRYVLALADEFYALATSIDDGFVGRNRLRATQIRKTLDSLQGDDVKELLARHKAACEKLGPSAKAACQKHFE
ncbi:MAG: thioredoxin family protein [Polyangiaceae bacterium]|nr:thioredoxin family protein [Polyangiaceae bacterium]